MRAALALAIALATAVPPSAAGSERTPDVPGVPDYPDPALDFLGAWLESASDGVIFTVKFGGADARPVDHFYAISFRYDGSRQVAGVAFDPNGTAHTDLRAPNWNRPLIRGPENMSGALHGATFRPGHPAYVSATIPFSALPDLGPGKVLVDLSGGTGTYTRGGGWDDVDGNQTSHAYVVERAVLPASAQSLRTPLAIGLIVAMGVAGGVAGVMIARRKK